MKTTQPTFLQKHSHTEQFETFVRNTEYRDVPSGPEAKTARSQWRGQGSIPDQGTRSRMPQLRPGTAKWNKLECLK